jgi:hypothetical protein
LRVIVILLNLNFDVVSLELERNTLLPAGLLDGCEEIADQFVGAPLASTSATRNPRRPGHAGNVELTAAIYG